MKKLMAVLFAGMIVVSFSQPAHARWVNVDFDYGQMKHKAKRGAVNLVSAPLEIPKQIKEEVKATEGKAAKTIAVFGGTAKGLVYTVGRFGSGLYDVLTFNINWPKDFEPLMKPEFVCEKKDMEKNK